MDFALVIGFLYPTTLGMKDSPFVHQDGSLETRIHPIANKELTHLLASGSVVICPGI
jgi:hypothetical protein